jgi:hypothetical protein
MNSPLKTMALLFCLFALAFLLSDQACSAACTAAGSAPDTLQQDPDAGKQDPDAGKQDPDAGKQDPEAGKSDDEEPKAKLRPLGRGKGNKGNKGQKRELKTRKAGKKKNQEGKDGQRIQISQSGKTRQENPTVIADIDAYRQEPLPFFTCFKDRNILDLENVGFGADVVATIDGREITGVEFRMNVVDSLGALVVDRFITAIITEDMKKKLIAEGADPALFVVSEEAIDADINNQMMMAKQQDRTGKFNEEDWKKMVDQSIGWQNYRNMQSSALAFGCVFLPEIEPKEGAAQKSPAKKEGEEEAVPLDPNVPVGKTKDGKDINVYIPLHTWNCLAGSDMGCFIRESLNEAYKNGTPLGPFIRPQYVRTVRDTIVKATEVKYHNCGSLSEGVYMKVGDTEIALDEIFPIVSGQIKDEDLSQVLAELLVFKAIDSVLDSGEWTLTEEEFETEFAAHEKLYEGSIFSLQFVMNLHGYYLLEDYRKMFRRKLAFKKMFQASGAMTDEKLKNFFEKGGRLFYQNGGVKVQSIFFSIFDHKTMQVRENGYAWVHEKMAGVLKELEEGADFLEVARKYENVNGFNRPAENDYLTRNDFRYQFGEKMKYILLEGYCLADDCFYSAKPGDIIGPIKVTRGEFGNPVFKGEYLVKVVGYRSMLELNSFEQSKNGIIEDYVDLNFLYWAAQTLAGADVRVTREAK